MLYFYDNVLLLHFALLFNSLAGHFFEKGIELKGKIS